MTSRVQLIQYALVLMQDVVTAFGYGEKSVTFYKSQINRMRQLNQITDSDVDVIYTLLNMRESNSIDWAETDKKVRAYTMCINMVDPIIEGNSTMTSKAVVHNIINQLKQNNLISADVAEVVLKTYGLQSIGETDVKHMHKGKSDKAKSDKEAQKLSLLDLSETNLVVRIRNPEAVCSGDTAYFDLSPRELYLTGKKIDRSLYMGIYKKQKNPAFDGCSGQAYIWVKTDIGLVDYEFKAENTKRCVDCGGLNNREC